MIISFCDDLQAFLKLKDFFARSQTKRLINKMLRVNKKTIEVANKKRKHIYEEKDEEKTMFKNAQFRSFRNTLKLFENDEKKKLNMRSKVSCKEK